MAMEAVFKVLPSSTVCSYKNDIEDATEDNVADIEKYNTTTL